MKDPVSNFKNWKANEDHLGLALDLRTYMHSHQEEEDNYDNHDKEDTTLKSMLNK